MSSADGDYLYEFEEGGSGPFAEETIGRWKPREATIRDYRRVFVKYWLFGDYSYLVQTDTGRRFIDRMENVLGCPSPAHVRHARKALNGSRMKPVVKQSLKRRSAWLLGAKMVGFALSFCR